MAANRRLLLLGATLIVAIAVMVVRSGSESPATSAPVSAARPAPPGAAGNADTGPAPDVNLAALTRGRSEPTDEGRNPFRFRPKPPPPPPAAAPPSPMAPGSGPLGGNVVPTGPPQPPPPPPITLKFIGIVEKADGMRLAVLSDGKRPIYGQEGQEIEGRYKILKIGTESLEIAYIDGRGRRTLPLNGQ